MKKNLLIIVLILVITACISPLLYKGTILLRSIYWNYNPDKVNLNKDGWKKIFSFVTIKKQVQVDVYGRKGIKDSIREFVISRKGVLPFNLSLTSPIYKSNLGNWLTVWESCTTMVGEPIGYYYDLDLEVENQYFNKVKHNFTPTFYFRVAYETKNDSLKLVFIRYFHCDELAMIPDLYKVWFAGKRFGTRYRETNGYFIFPELLYLFNLKEDECNKAFR